MYVVIIQRGVVTEVPMSIDDKDHVKGGRVIEATYWTQ
jgi:hypothetical protein